MISAYNSIPQSVAVNGQVQFDTNRILTGCTVQHNSATSPFRLTKPGYYYVTFNATVAAEAGNVIISLQQNGVTVPGATATVTTTAVADSVPLSFATIIKVNPSCRVCDGTTDLTLVNTGLAATYQVANINITKLC